MQKSHSVGGFVVYTRVFDVRETKGLHRTVVIFCQACEHSLFLPKVERDVTSHRFLALTGSNLLR